MNANNNTVSLFGGLDKQKLLTAFYWFLALLAVSVFFMGFAEASGAGGGNALEELNDWLEDELGGSVGTAIGLVAFLSGLIAAVATRAFMPIIWGMGLGIVLGIFLNVVVTATSAGMPIVQTAQAVGLLS